jgi:membrane protease YdiL (CAAX protease family)
MSMNPSVPTPPDPSNLPANDFPASERQDVEPLLAIAAAPSATGTDSASPPKPWRPGPGLLGAVGWLIAYIAIQVVPVAVLLVMQKGIAVADSETREFVTENSVLIAVVACLAGVAIPVALFRSQSRRLLAIRGIRPVHLVICVLLVVPLLTINLQLASWFGELTRKEPLRELENPYEPIMNQSMTIVFVVLCVLPAVGEETFFRGFLGRGLLARWQLIPGMLLTSLPFGLLHFESREHIVATTLLGICLHAAYVMTRTLAAPIIMHILNNTVPAIGFKVAMQEGLLDKDTLHQMDTLPPLLLISGACAVVALGALLYQTRTRWLLPDGSTWSPGYVATEMPPAGVPARAVSGSPRWIAVAAAVASCVTFGAAIVSVGR